MVLLELIAVSMVWIQSWTLIIESQISSWPTSMVECHCSTLDKPDFPHELCQVSVRVVDVIDRYPQVLPPLT